MEKNKLLNFIKIGILFFGIPLLLFNCENEPFIKTSNTENEIFLNKDFLKIKEELNLQISSSNNKGLHSKSNNPKFEQIFGKPYYNSAFNLETQFKTIIIPTQNTETNKIKGWLSGYYRNDTLIKFKFSFATKQEIETINLEYLNFAKTESSKNQNNNSHSKASGCQSYYYTRCYTSEWLYGEETQCKTFYAGTICTFNELTESTGEEDLWIDPLDGDNRGGGSGGAIDNEYCNTIGLVYDPILKTCVEETKCPEGEVEDDNGNCVKKPCNGDPVKNPEIVSSGSLSGRKGGSFGCTRSNPNKTCGGVKGKKNHDGIDIKAEVNTSTFSMYKGKVSSLRDTFSAGEYKKNSYGNYIIIKSTVNGKTIYIRYNHLNKVSVKKDQDISVGQIIGLNGNTGNAAAKGVTPHIHIQVLDSSWKSINPADYLKTKFDSEYKPISNNCN